MSETKKFLADPDNWSVDTMHSQNHPDPKVRRLTTNLIMRDRLLCADGFSMSVQYSPYHYCNGREKFLGGEMDNCNDPLPDPKSVEIGFPSWPEELLAEYAEEGETYRWPSLRDKMRWSDCWKYLFWLDAFWPTKSNLTRTVYGWVPIEVVDRVVAKHGGIVGTQRIEDEQ